MKKLLLILGLIGVLIGCGMKTYSPEEKRELVLKSYSEDKVTREKASDKYYEIIKELSLLESKGNKKAGDEYIKWKSVLKNVSKEVQMKKQAISRVNFRRKYNDINDEEYKKELIEAKKDPEGYLKRIEKEKLNIWKSKMGLD